MVRSDFLTVTRDDAPTPGAVLMERDATAFARAEAAGGCAPSLRWFRWDRPTLSLGRGQDAGADVDLGRCTADGVPVVVRPTGGRAVFHVDEWTYAALVPLSHATLGGSLRDSCRALVSLVAAALARAYDVRVDRAT
jgi:lipoate-protein ligase A